MRGLSFSVHLEAPFSFLAVGEPGKRCVDTGGLPRRFVQALMNPRSFPITRSPWYTNGVQTGIIKGCGGIREVPMVTGIGAASSLTSHLVCPSGEMSNISIFTGL